MMKKKEYVEGDELAKGFEENPEDWESVSEEEQTEIRVNLKGAKEKRISIRISATILSKLRKLAAREGLPYQTYINSVLFKIANQEGATVEATVEELQKRMLELEEEVNRLKKAS